MGRSRGWKWCAIAFQRSEQDNDMSRGREGSER